MIGTATECYAYFLYSTASALIFGKLFFPTVSQTAATLSTFAIFGVTFFVRPIGAVIFGHYEARIGRKKMLIVSILVMGLSTILIGLLPTYDAIGIWAPIALIVLRITQGFAVGGEYGGATVMALEFAPPGKRGFYAALPQVGNPLGLLLGTCSVYLFTLLPEKQFLDWGWRVPFLLSTILVGIDLYIRTNIGETPAFEQAKVTGQVKSAPLVTLLRDYKRELILIILAPAALNVSFYIYPAWSIPYMVHHRNIPTTVVLAAVMIAAALDAFAQPFFGALSDRVGRKPVYIGGSIWFGLVAFPFFWLVDTGSPTLIVIAMILTVAIGHGAAYSVQASFMSELFGTDVRYSGLSIGYHLSAAILAGPAPFVAASLVAWTGNTHGISIAIAIAAVTSVVSVLMLGETNVTDIKRTYRNKDPKGM